MARLSASYVPVLFSTASQKRCLLKRPRSDKKMETSVIKSREGFLFLCSTNTQIFNAKLQPISFLTSGSSFSKTVKASA